MLRVLQAVLARHARQGLTQHLVYISLDNLAAQRLAHRAGFRRTPAEPNEHGYAEYRRLA
jgi:hypothetical protein